VVIRDLHDVNLVDDTKGPAILSTKFPIKADTQPLPLTVLLETASRSILHNLVARLRACGHAGVTDPHLVLIGNLDCGATHAAQIAQRLDVSRQAISKTLRELQKMGVIRLENDTMRRNQKVVVMTAMGERLALDARRELAEIEALIANEIGPEAMVALRSALELKWGAKPTAPSARRGLGDGTR
jgi:DNA-binding MarR family transcriptional regulator